MIKKTFERIKTILKQSYQKLKTRLLKFLSH